MKHGYGSISKRFLQKILDGKGKTPELIKEVEKIFGARHPYPLEIEKAKKVLKDHGQALVDTIARLEEASDGESDEIAFSHGQSMEREQQRRKQPFEEMGEGRMNGGFEANN